MTHLKKRNNDMYLEEWYSNYLMKYVDIISKPKYNQKQRIKFNEVLLNWYENFGGYMEEQTKWMAYFKWRKVTNIKVWTVVKHNHKKNRVRFYNYKREYDARHKINDLYKDFVLNSKKASYVTPSENHITIADIKNENILCELYMFQNSVYG